MRVLHALAVLPLSIMAIWHVPQLSATTPQVVVQNAEFSECTSARALADSDAAALGFAKAELPCPQTWIANLAGIAAPKPARARAFLDYNDFDRLTATPGIGTGFVVPEQIPFAAATSTIVAHVPVDELYVALRVDDVLAAAFALESAGVSRDDMANTFKLNNLLVRVRPFSEERVRRIVKTVSAIQPSYDFVQYSEVGFIRDCEAAYRSLSALALEDTHRRALVMARAANVGLGGIVGVVDAGGSVADAVCGTGAEPSMHDAVGFAQPGATSSGVERVDMAVPGVATVVRRLSAAWRLSSPPNGYGAYYEFAPHGTQRERSMMFLANGNQAEGDAMAIDSLKPDGVTIQISDDAARLLRHSPYANDLIYAHGEMLARVSPAVVLHAPNAAALRRAIQAVRIYVLSRPGGAQASKDWWYAFVSDNCHSSLDDALYAATRQALTRIGTNRVRYLEQWQGTTFNVACTGVPPMREIGPVEMWQSSDQPFAGFSNASVVVGY